VPLILRDPEAMAEKKKPKQGRDSSNDGSLAIPGPPGKGKRESLFWDSKREAKLQGKKAKGDPLFRKRNFGKIDGRHSRQSPKPRESDGEHHESHFSLQRIKGSIRRF